MTFTLEHFPSIYNYIIENFWGTTNRLHQINMDYAISYDEKDPLCYWTALLSASDKFNIRFVELSQSELAEIQRNLEAHHVLCSISSSFYSFAQLKMPLYQILWNTFNNEIRSHFTPLMPSITPSLFCKK